MNGSAMFAERLSLWAVLLLMAAASCAQIPPRAAATVLTIAVLVFATALGVLQSRLAPVARELQVATYPKNGLSNVRVVSLGQRQQPADLTFDPYFLSSVRIVDRGNGLLVDAPWLGNQLNMLERIGPDLIQDQKTGLLRARNDDGGSVAAVWNHCHASEPTLWGKRTDWHVSRYGCFSVAEQPAEILHGSTL